MKYLLILSCLLFTSVGWSQEYGEQQQFMTDLIGETITKNKSAVNSASKTRNWIKASNELCESATFDAFGLKEIWSGRVSTIDMDDDGRVNIRINIGNGNTVQQYSIKNSLIDTVLDIPIKSMVQFSGYFVEGNMSENECLDGGITASPDMLRESFKFQFTDVVPYNVENIKNVENKKNRADIKREGEYLTHYDNGQLWSKSNWKDGKLEGEQLTHDDNGQLIYKENYKDGKQDGETSWYNENGHLRKTEIYKDGKLEGKVRFKYYVNMQKLFQEFKMSELIYVFGIPPLLEGKEGTKYNGKLKEKRSFKFNGKVDGEWLYYKEGEQLYYKRNGKLKWKKYYKDGKRDGEWLFYNRNDQLKKTKIYKDGKLIKTIKP